MRYILLLLAFVAAPATVSYPQPVQYEPVTLRVEMAGHPTLRSRQQVQVAGVRGGEVVALTVVQGAAGQCEDATVFWPRCAADVVKGEPVVIDVTILPTEEELVIRWLFTGMDRAGEERVQTIAVTPRYRQILPLIGVTP